MTEYGENTHHIVTKGHQSSVYTIVIRREESMPSCPDPSSIYVASICDDSVPEGLLVTVNIGAPCQIIG